MQQAFLDIDVAIREKQSSDNSGDGSGCTAVTAMITPSYIVCANAGDSRCVLATNNGTKAMSEDHKPYDEPERRRIEAAGGRVQWRRVDGDLAVSRAFGDFQYKMRDDLGPKEQKVRYIVYSARPTSHRYISLGVFA
jgi:serine/threonine protein phosphatase PrpC